MACSLVWFKRDLRVHDHAPLAAAAAAGPVLGLYVIEPGLWAQPDMATQHYLFIRESVSALAQQFAALGGRLLVRGGEMTAVLERLHAELGIDALYSHEETGNDWTFARDRAVAAWCRRHGVHWQEFRQFGVVRRLQDRDEWRPAWEALMAQPPLPPPARLAAPLPPLIGHRWPDPAALGLTDPDPPLRQRGGRANAELVLTDFLNERVLSYRGGISSPLSAPTACSRLSAHLAYGLLSLREVVHAARLAMANASGPQAERQRRGLAAFVSRLYWHCHFIQKLESEPALEFRNLHRGYDGLREADWSAAHFAAWSAGRTGWPLVDACMAMLRATGWLNFRMRAMLVSVAAYPLWLHWREPGLFLARQFLDYEPGIHWSQLQMQSGTTGINTARVYNPVKQARDHDPQGRFVRHWLPALRRVPDSWLFEPWRMPPAVQAQCGVRVGEDIPEPPVELERATRVAKERLYALRRDPGVRAARAAVLERHGSRLRPAARRKAAARASGAQLELEF
ncbi:cryptochrome/deoxyribodipyrimidine photo-lyase family protein [Chitinilyticum litopenaei]|uniref:cryptochrome/deoxyribodipyrimidine photo-lyase family protein n=1 Tax=Chitinilyticum litopenaei TaxID=1121276 RepID=UPI00048F5A41|nr:FAD-binding domain-containing protein [Chitinilyticum litopenaei]